MASQVLSGTGNVSYTNNTGQNVRVVINYMRAVGSPGSINLSWAGVTASAVYLIAIGRNLAFNVGDIRGSGGLAGIAIAIAANNLAASEGSSSLSVPGENVNNALPTELMLAPGQTFSATCGAHNIVIIPEGG